MRPELKPGDVITGRWLAGAGIVGVDVLSMNGNELRVKCRSSRGMVWREDWSLEHVVVGLSKGFYALNEAP